MLRPSMNELTRPVPSTFSPAAGIGTTGRYLRLVIKSQSSTSTFLRLKGMLSFIALSSAGPSVSGPFVSSLRFRPATAAPELDAADDAAPAADAVNSVAAAASPPVLLRALPFLAGSSFSWGAAFSVTAGFCFRFNASFVSRASIRLRSLSFMIRVASTHSSYLRFHP